VQNTVLLALTVQRGRNRYLKEGEAAAAAAAEEEEEEKRAERGKLARLRRLKKLSTSSQTTGIKSSR
jgi:hypothetical protein